MTVRSLTLYGDGRVELFDNRSDKYERLREFAELERVLSGAVEGLEDARQLVNGVPDEDRLVHIWDERIVGTAGFKQESKF